MDNPIRVFNSSKRTVEPLVPREDGRIGMYVCGMTVYDLCHIGHARAMITFDMVYRYLRHRGYDVTYVRNHTDVDDKIINRAHERGEDPLALSAHYIEALDQDLAGFGLLPPTVQPKVSEHIPQIIATIEAIVARGHGYVVGGDVFFHVPSLRSYGYLSGRDVEQMRAGERVEVDERKRHPADFALWKSVKPGEPAWESPWGPGRPGWHIECTAMSQHYLGEQFDIHGGGSDLLFPHHENEIAQAEGASGKRPFVNYWLHNGMLTLIDDATGEPIKMSKSLGNVINIRDLLREMPGEALKLLYLEHHYRSPALFSRAALSTALGNLDRLYQAKEQALCAQAVVDETHRATTAAEEAREMGGPALELHASVEAFVARFHAAMDADLNTAQALGELFELVTAVNRLAGAKKAMKRAASVLASAAACFDLVAEVLGIGAMAPAAFFEEMRVKRLAALGVERSQVEALLVQRAEARQAKDWPRADAIRVQLDAWNIVVMDSPEGTTWRVRV
ncbi:MAG: cysteine--tRNA ligase [Pseudomonadota bacterium]